jgi:hypothetical protein
MPTWSRTERFFKDWMALSPEQRQAFRQAVKEFIADLGTGQFRRGLRVQRVAGTSSVFEMTWEGGNGRATFEYGPEVHPGERHVIWRRVGGHSIFKNP